MKQILRTLLGMLALVLIPACSDDDGPALQSLFELSKEEFVFAAGDEAGFDARLTVKADAEAQLASDATWLHTTSRETSSTYDGYTLTVFSLHVDANTGTDDRTAVLTLTAGTHQTEIPVMQKGIDALLADQSLYNITSSAQQVEIGIQASASGYEAVANDKWITVDDEGRSRTLTAYTLKVSVAANYGNERTGTVTLTLDGMEQTVTIRQAACAPLEADRTGMEHSALELARDIRIGWNLGNSLECPSNETAWGNPATTQALIDLVKQAGFNAVRIPCAWSNGHLIDSEQYIIDPSWLARVREVVEYCTGQGMYAIINIHHDGGWLENNPTADVQDEVNAKQRALWTQIANYFGDADEHLLFAGTNEVHVDGVYNNDQVTEENHRVQQSYNQTFVEAVRATGGKNAYRNLIVQAYNTNCELAVDYLELPQDEVEGRLLVEVHNYDPTDYTLDDTVAYWGAPWSSFGVSAWGQEDYIDQLFADMKARFADRGIPVILGEFGANRHSSTDTDKVDSRAYYLAYMVKAARASGMVPFYWDNGGTADGGDQFALFDRSALQVLDQSAINALMDGVGQSAYPW